MEWLGTLLAALWGGVRKILIKPFTKGWKSKESASISITIAKGATTGPIHIVHGQGQDVKVEVGDSTSSIDRNT